MERGGTKLNTDSIPLPVTHATVAAAFAICGAVSAAFLLSGFPNAFCIWFPIPFVLLGSLLFMRTLLLAPIMWAVWPFSHLAAFLVGFSGWPVAPGCAGGLLGALGLMFCSAVRRKELFSSKYFIRAAVIGTLGGVPFTPWASSYLSSNVMMNHPDSSNPPLFAFAIWQAAVGTYLYAINTDERSEREGDDSEEDDVSVIRLNLPR